MGKSLVIVESPAKARTIAGYLGGEYAVESSIGHIRDLPNRASDVPSAKRKRFGALGVDVEKGFEPYYVVDPEKKKVVTRAEEATRRAPTSSCSRRTRTARARRSPGTSSRC